MEVITFGHENVPLSSEHTNFGQSLLLWDSHGNTTGHTGEDLMFEPCFNPQTTTLRMLSAHLKCMAMEVRDNTHMAGHSNCFEIVSCVRAPNPFSSSRFSAPDPAPFHAPLMKWLPKGAPHSWLSKMFTQSLICRMSSLNDSHAHAFCIQPWTYLPKDCWNWFGQVSSLLGNPVGANHICFLCLSTNPALQFRMQSIHIQPQWTLLGLRIFHWGHKCRDICISATAPHTGMHPSGWKNS